MNLFFCSPVKYGKKISWNSYYWIVDRAELFQSHELTGLSTHIQGRVDLLRVFLLSLVDFTLMPIDKGFPFSFMNVWWSNFFQLKFESFFFYLRKFSHT